MANATKQVTENRGSDSADSTTNRDVTANSARTTTPQTTTQNQTEGAVNTTETSQPSTHTTVESSISQSTVTNEDKAFTLTFEVLLSGPLPCERLII